MIPLPRTLCFGLLLTIFTGLTTAVPPASKPEVSHGNAAAPAVEPKPASDTATLTAKLKLAEGMSVELFAADPLLANPLCIYIDEAGRLWVGESYRQGEEGGIPDNRGHANWVDTDLAAQTVEDRRQMYLKFLTPEKLQQWSQHEERITVVEDTDGDGKADASRVFADGWKDILDGSGAGLLVRRGEVYYTNIPALYRLKDTNADGKADVREVMSTGYGVRVALRGHDMHGLRFGPDGKLYWSIGDRGYNVTAPDGRKLADPTSGAVFRCNPDGSELEVFATGLRNPQELVFDDEGNLWTGDNNSDAGDKARWVYIVEGGDSGWRMSYQYRADRGPWMPERWWDPPFKGQAAFVVPPVGHITNGPSGLAYYPGVGLSSAYDNHFFLCDFKGSPERSGVYSFTVKPRGAGFEMVDVKEFVWGVLATDCDFGPDGALYVSDWVEGWTGVGKGRVWKLTDPQAAKDRAVAETRRILAAGFGEASSVHLIRYLAHRDQRVRLEAQFALAAKGDAATDAVNRVLDNSGNPQARLHALWALGIIARKDPIAVEHVVNNLANESDTLRGQAAKLVGDLRLKHAIAKLLPLLEDRSPRVRFFAAIAVGKLAHPPAVKPLIESLRRNADEDPWLRHALVMGLAGCADDAAMLSAASDTSAAVRMGALLALRRRQSPKIARFLSDTDPLIVVEAARAINDAPINAAMPALAALIAKPTADDALLRRVINANFRLGSAEHAAALAKLASGPAANEAMRREALDALSDWREPSGRDRVMGLWRPLPPRDPQPAAAAAAIKAVFPQLLTDAPEPVKVRAIEAATALRADVVDSLHALAADVKHSPKLRVAALKAAGELKDPRLNDLVQPALKDTHADVRKQAQRLVVSVGGDSGLAIEVLKDVLKSGSLPEKQGALATLATINKPVADKLLLAKLDQHAKSKLAAELELDLLLAAEARRKDNPQINERLKALEAQQSQDPLAPYRAATVGGDAEAGRKVFWEHTAGQCLRCHKMEGTGGEAGPDLAKVATRGDRRFLLESLVNPSDQIAPGYGTVVLTLKNGNILAGAMRSEAGGEITLIDAASKPVVVKTGDVVSRTPAVSAMPPMGAVLNKRELRDLVEYLATRK